MATAKTSYVPTAAEASVADLLLRLGDGDPTAWEEIVSRYGELVYATVRTFRLQGADTRDATQTTWLHLAEHAHQIRHPERLSGWLVTTARRICLRIVNHANHPLVLFDPVTETVADPFAGPEQRVIDADSTRRLWNFVSELSPRRQALLRVLFTEHSRPYTEVARLAGIPAGGIGPTRARALAQLRDTLEKHGLGPAAW
ncbi:MAG TPA: sigma-70 family RNA polymerase sigma factor [Pseudonocardiaceae bacterium]|jgi:RNA polymerase sigma factor (sigma-70 family)|nr:sigma-70 family RNA polymerase sigma factor [Pseudonocardiaceae bacterium]